MRDELKRFFDAYKASFSQGPTQIAAFYSEPCVAARMGVVRVNPTLKETEALFAEVDRQYRAKGFTQAEYVLKDFRSLGANSAMATVHWAYKNAQGAALWETTFSYNLYRRNGVWKILVQTMHDS